MKKAIFKYFSTVLAIALLFSSAISLVIFSDEMLDNTKQDMMYAVKLIEHQIDYNDSLDVQVRNINEVAFNEDSRLTIIDANGTVLADSDRQSIKENHKSRQEVKDALANGQGYATRYSTTLKKNLLYVAYLNRNHVVRLSIPYNGIFDNIIPLVYPLAVSTFFSILIAIALSYKFTKTLNHPLNEITKEISRMKDNGQLSFDHYQYDEFNTIALKLKDQSLKIHEVLDTLRNERIKINGILDQMKEGFILLDHNENILMCNIKAKMLYPRIDVNHNVRDYIFDHKIIDALYTLGKETHVVDVKKNNEIYRCFLTRVEYGITLLFINVTETVNATKMRQEFFSNVSHELKTPMTSIKGYAGLLQEGMIENPEIKKRSLHKILKEVNNMENLINDILMISRLENKDVDVMSYPLTLKPIVDEILESMKMEIEKKNIDIYIDIEDVTYHSNHQYMHHLLNNLITNAIKYNKENGHLKVISKQSQNDLVIIVEDTGKGISTVDQNRVFERFFRCDEGRDKETGGTGLGLSIVKHIVQYYQGSIELKSELNVGTTFKIVLPKSEKE